MTQQTYDPNQILMGGGGAPAWKFDEPGTTRTGTIASPPSARQEREYVKENPGGGDLKFFPSGDPIMGIVVEVDTAERDPSDAEDKGRRTFYVEGRYIKEAVRNAVRAAGASGLEVGGQVTVTFTHREDPMDKRSRKYWDVKYVPAGNAALMGGDQTVVAQPAVTQEIPGGAPQYAAPVQQAPQAYAPPVQQAPQAAPAPAPQPMQEQLAQAAAPAGPDPQALAAFLAWQQSQQGNSHTA